MRCLTRILSPVLVVLLTTRVKAVVISEIHYHPPSRDYRGVEFVEIHNPEAQEVAVGGWSLQGGVSFTIPEGTKLAPGADLALARDASALKARFGASEAVLIGDFEDFLDNSREAIELVDVTNAFVDGVEYHDQPPWPVEADGLGASAQRLCMTAPGRDPLNWIGGEPTPGAANFRSSCPPPVFRTPRVVISELQYHPRVGPSTHSSLEDGEDTEFLELHNPGVDAVDLSNWNLKDGVKLTIPAGTTLPPGGFVVAGRNPELLKSFLGIANVIAVGYEGRLSNSGERIELTDSRGVVIDTVLYADSGDWPYGADGIGRSLERISASHSGNDPANWRTSTLVGAGFTQLVADGPAGLSLSQRLVIYIDGIGEMLIDRIMLEDVTTAETKLLIDETFDSGLGQWSAEGIAATSSPAPFEGVNGSGALRLVSTGACPNGDCGLKNSVSLPLTGIHRQGTFRTKVWIRFLSGSPKFFAGFSNGGGVTIDQLSTPGKANSNRGAIPPLVSHVNRFPRQPRSTENVWVTAAVRSRVPAVVTLKFLPMTAGVKGNETALNMLDDGNHGDHLPNDGVYGIAIAPFPHDTQVRFHITAMAEGLSGEYPIPLNYGGRQPQEAAGYYVEDLQPRSVLPVYHLLMDSIGGKNGISDVNAALRNCDITLPATFAYKGDLYPDIEVRFRGNTACYVLKRNFKLSFNKGRSFRGLKKLNLNSEWTDKSMVREHLAWDFMREVAAPYSATEFVRLHLNGGYFGLYLYVEHPDERFLDRNGLDASGNLYKAKQPPSGGRPLGVVKQNSLAEYMKLWEAETNELGDFSDLGKFIDDMHADGLSVGGPSSSFWRARSFEETIIGYQLGQVVLNNIDSFAKNHFLYHDLKQDLFAFITWDLDLTFGKFFSPQARDPAQGREVGTLNDLLLCSPAIQGDLNPWFASTVLQNPLHNFLVDFFFRADKGLYYQRAYLIRLWDILAEKFRNETYDSRLDDLSVSLASEEAEDRARWGRFLSNVAEWPPDMAANIEVVKQQIRCHRDFLLGYLSEYHSEVREHPRVKITEILYLPDGGEDDLEFLEIQNLWDKEVNLKGWMIAGIGGSDGPFTITTDTIVKAGEIFVVARSPGAFRKRHPELAGTQVLGPYAGKLANEGEELRVLDSGPGHPATLDYVTYANSGPWPDPRPGYSIELTRASVDRDNDPGANWRESRAPGGSPGTIEEVAPTFVRGELTADGKIDLSDAIFGLRYLFLGGTEPVCLDAADVNDDGRVNVPDSIYLLQHLFQGGAVPPIPYPDSGPDPTADTVGCAV